MNIIKIKLNLKCNDFDKLIKELYNLTKNESLQIGLIRSKLSENILISEYLTIDLNDYGQVMNTIFNYYHKNGFSMEVENRYSNQVGYFVQ